MTERYRIRLFECERFNLASNDVYMRDLIALSAAR